MLEMNCSQWKLSHNPPYWWSCGHSQKIETKKQGALTNLWLPLPNYYSSFFSCFTFFLLLWHPQFCGSPLFLGFYPLVVILPSPEKWALVHFPLWTFIFGHTCSPKNAGFLAKILIFLGLWQPQFCGSPLFLSLGCDPTFTRKVSFGSFSTVNSSFLTCVSVCSESGARE